MRIYLVRALAERDDDGTLLWWSNDAGWATIDQAIVFSEEEHRTLKAPLGGEWVQFTEVTS